MENKVSDFTYAELSDQAYKNPNHPEGYKITSPGWQFIDSSGPKDSAEGFFGAAFQKGNQIVIAFMGANYPDDVKIEVSALKIILETARGVNHAVI